MLDRFAKVKKASTEWLRLFRALTKNSAGDTHNDSGKSLGDAVTEVSQAYGEMHFNNKLKVDASWHQSVMMRLDAYEQSLTTRTNAGLGDSPGTGKGGSKKSKTGGTGKAKSKMEIALSAVSDKAFVAQKVASDAMLQNMFDKQEEQRAEDKEDDAPFMALLAKSLNPAPTAGGELPRLMQALAALRSLPESPAIAANIKRIEDKISAAAFLLAGLA